MPDLFNDRREVLTCFVDSANLPTSKLITKDSNLFACPLFTRSCNFTLAALVSALGFRPKLLLSTKQAMSLEGIVRRTLNRSCLT